jgi:hypothetical protein
VVKVPRLGSNVRGKLWFGVALVCLGVFTWGLGRYKSGEWRMAVAAYADRTPKSGNPVGTMYED